MTKLLGNDYLFWVESAVAGTYTPLKGQGTLSETRQQVKIDTSDKTTGGYGTNAFGMQMVSMSIDLKADLPDAGYTRLETMVNARTSFNVQLRKNGAAGVTADSVFTSLVYATISSRTFNKDGTVDLKIEFTIAAAPTVDVLA